MASDRRPVGTSGNPSVRTSSVSACSMFATQSSMPAAMLGMISSPNPNASPPLQPAPGHRSLFNAAGIKWRGRPKTCIGGLWVDWSQLPASETLLIYSTVLGPSDPGHAQTSIFGFLSDGWKTSARCGRQAPPRPPARATPAAAIHGDRLLEKTRSPLLLKDRRRADRFARHELIRHQHMARFGIGASQDAIEQQVGGDPSHLGLVPALQRDLRRIEIGEL